MNSIPTNAIISSTGELTIKLPPEFVPGTSIVVVVVYPQINSTQIEKIPTITDIPHPNWNQDYLHQVLGGWIGEPPQHPEALTWKERDSW